MKTELYEMVKVAGILATIVLTIIEPTTWSGHACSYSILILIIFLSFGVGFWGLHLHGTFPPCFPLHLEEAGVLHDCIYLKLMSKTR